MFQELVIFKFSEHWRNVPGNVYFQFLWSNIPQTVLFPIYPQTLLLIYLETEGIFQALYISHLSGDQETGDKFQKLCISNLLRLETPYRNCLFPVYLEL